jgi:NAD(P)H-hydrate repair Nnr-like enzyme with NAD(P)H-hydrate dehydratase domain
MTPSYWQRQTQETPLFPDIEWSKPEQRSLAGRLAIIGGNTLGFAALAGAYSDALKTGSGECKVVLPSTLKRSIPSTITDVVFVATNPSGGMARDSSPQIQAAAEWSTGTLLIGDAGRNSETAIVFEDLLRHYDGPLTITRDAIDLLKANSQLAVSRDNTLLVVSFAQLQKLFQSVYYPKILTFSMQLLNLVEALHKFTITYPAMLMVLHHEHIIIAQGGNITTTPWEHPMAIWRGSVATKAAVYWAWNPKKPLQAASASLLSA